jgi:hypothetical protein
MLHYTTQNPVTAFNNVTLTNTYSDNEFIIVTGGMAKLTVDLDYARGSGEGSSKLQIKMQHSIDQTNWYGLVIDDTTTTSVITERVWEVDDSASLDIILDIAYLNMRIQVNESGVTTNYGTLTMNVMASGL